jgi:hypothetical protein
MMIGVQDFFLKKGPLSIKPKKAIKTRVLMAFFVNDEAFKQLHIPYVAL